MDLWSAVLQIVDVQRSAMMRAQVVIALLQFAACVSARVERLREQPLDWTKLRLQTNSLTGGLPNDPFDGDKHAPKHTAGYYRLNRTAVCFSCTRVSCCCSAELCGTGGSCKHVGEFQSTHCCFPAMTMPAQLSLIRRHTGLFYANSPV